MTRHSFVFLVLLAACAAPAAEPRPGLRVGAARVDITPPMSTPVPMAGYPGREDGQKGIHDNLYVRAIVIDDGATKAAIVVNDLLELGHGQWERVSERIAGTLGMPRENILLASTHTHGGPEVGTPDEKTAIGQYALRVDRAMLEAAQAAAAALQPARVGAGAGRANLNINRRALFWDDRWWLGFNPDGFSDKTVGVVKFEDLKGKCLAILVNYGVHGTSMSMENQVITGDNPGATSRYIEEHHPDHPVAVFTSGAAGDQAPIYDRSPQAFSGVLNMGRLLGGEALRVAATLNGSGDLRVRGAVRVIRCPGRKRVQPELNGKKYDFVDAEPVDIRLSALRLGDIALTGVSGEVFSIIGQETRNAAPAASTLMITHCNGSIGYIPDDASYDQVSYEIQVTPLKPGCAEKMIPQTLADMVRSLAQ